MYLMMCVFIFCNTLESKSPLKNKLGERKVSEQTSLPGTKVSKALSSSDTGNAFCYFTSFTIKHIDFNGSMHFCQRGHWEQFSLF